MSEPAVLPHVLFEQAVDRDPHAPALVWEGCELSYGELEEAANTVAGDLAAHGVRAGDRVVVFAERSPAGVAGLFGALKAGAVCVPVEPSEPAERLREMFAAVTPKAVITVGTPPPGQAMAHLAGQQTLVRADISVRTTGRVSARPDDRSPAFIFFTSGSTGRPQGVVHSHRSAGSTLLPELCGDPIHPDDRVLGTAPMGTLRTTGELYWPLTSGACLVLARPGGQRDVRYLAELARTAGISIMNTTPSLLGLLLDEPAFTDAGRLRLIHCSAEPLTPELFARFRAVHSAQLRNVYGQTECAPILSWEGGPSPVPGKMPLGRPTPVAGVRLLDEDLRRVPDGEVGEICVTGPALALGYVDDTARTEERFPVVPEPGGGAGAGAGRRILRTGDLARRHTDGIYYYEGRRDAQINVNGYRVSPAEIERVLETHSAVRRAAVLMAPPASGGDEVLTAFLVPETGVVHDGPGTGELHEFLAPLLPRHMHPRSVVLLAEMPLLPSGKTDRQQLTQLSPRQPQAPRSDAGGRTDVPEAELLVREIVHSVLRITEFAPEDNFYALGGSSLQLMRVISLLNTRTTGQLDVSRLATEPTLGALVAETEIALAAALR